MLFRAVFFLATPCRSLRPVEAPGWQAQGLQGGVVQRLGCSVGERGAF